MKSKKLSDYVLYSVLFSASIHVTCSLPIPQPNLLDGLFGGFFGSRPAATQDTAVQSVSQPNLPVVKSATTGEDSAESDDDAPTNSESDDSSSPLAKISAECRKEAATYTGCTMRCLSGLLGAETAKEGWISATTLRTCTFKTCQKKIESDNCLGEITLLGVGELRNIAKSAAKSIDKHTTQLLTIGEKGAGGIENLTKSLSDVTGKLATG